MEKIYRYDRERAREMAARKERIAIGEKARPETRKAHIDYNILAVVLVLVAIGLIVQYSTTYHLAYTEHLTKEAVDAVLTKNLPVMPTEFLRQLLLTATGLVLMYLTMRFWKPTMKRLTMILSWLSLIAAVMTGIVGVVINGQRRWLKIGSFTVQPSDFFKVALILLLAYLLCDKNRHTLREKKTVLLMIVYLAPVGLVAYHDLSTGIVLSGIWFVVGFISFLKFKNWVISILLLVGAAVGAMLKFGASYRMQRFTSWLFEGGDYQTRQGLQAIASGGMFGKGIGNSVMKTRVPEAENDFVFSIFCEEFGIVGGILLILLFVFLFARIYHLIRRTNDRFRFLVLTGILIHMSMQVVINMAVTLKMMPNTGIGLPFISKGGSSIIAFLVEMGILLKLSLYISKEPLPSPTMPKRPKRTTPKRRILQRKRSGGAGARKDRW